MLAKPARRRAFLVLTPLIDVLFLLLIFFMLSSQIAPYSLIPLSGVFSGSDQTSDTPGSSAGSSTGSIALRVTHGHVGIGRDRIAIAELKVAADAFRQQGIERYLLIPTATADVQDVVSTLEALKAASAGEVTVLSPRHGGR